MSLQHKVALVTGASSGIGAAIAIKFAEEGAKVAIVGRNEQKLKNVAKKCNNPLILVADVSKDKDVIMIINKTTEHFGKLDILINNAGIVFLTSIQNDNAIIQFDQTVATNLRAPVYLTNLAVPHLKKTKGNIVNISSVASTRVNHEFSFAYNVSKAGLDHFTRSIAIELAPFGIRVNNVNPGPVKTDIINNSTSDPSEIASITETFQNMTALKRMSEPEEVAEVVLFLASDKAKGVTGSSYFIDNGLKS